MEEINLKPLSEEEMHLVSERVVQYTSAALEMFNNFLEKSRQDGVDPRIVNNAVLQTILTLALGVITSITEGKNESTCSLLESFIDRLDTYLAQLEEFSTDLGRESYTASEETHNLETKEHQDLETKEHQDLGRQGRQVTCFDPNEIPCDSTT